ncbi:unnamed protein product [Coregonus sp. 'balchen']|nr:unnamed protein product [Coregonus sp. 'balchen']
MTTSDSDKCWRECMDVAVEVAFRVGKVVQEAVKHEKNVSTKSTPTDLVTEADQQVEELIISTLRDKFPSHRFIGEESSAAGEKCILTDSPSWIIDPIDGTCNFVHSFPMVAVSIGFAVKKELEFGVIYHCFDGTLYTARKGHGAFCNGVRIQVSKEKATGAAEAYYQYGLHCWDIAAAAVIIREAGGVVIDTTGGPLDLMSRRVVAAGTHEMANYVVQQLQPISYKRDDSDPGVQK